MVLGVVDAYRQRFPHKDNHGTPYLGHCASTFLPMFCLYDQVSLHRCLLPHNTLETLFKPMKLCGTMVRRQDGPMILTPCPYDPITMVRRQDGHVPRAGPGDVPVQRPDLAPELPDQPFYGHCGPHGRAAAPACAAGCGDDHAAKGGVAGTACHPRVGSMSCYTIPCHAIPYHTIPYHTIPYHTMPYHTMPYHAMPYHTTKPSQAMRPNNDIAHV